MERKRFRSLSAAEQERRLEWKLEHGGKKPHSFSAADALLKGFWGKAGVREDRVAILNAVWEKEVGAFRRHWSLVGVRSGVVHVRASSSASGQELALRSAELVRGLNKHFRKPWIRSIKKVA